MKFLGLILLSSLSFSVLASDEIQKAFNKVTDAITKSFVISNEEETIRVSLETVDISTLECFEDSPKKVICFVDLKKKDANGKKKVLILEVDSEIDTISNGLIPLTKE